MCHDCPGTHTATPAGTALTGTAANTDGHARTHTQGSPVTRQDPCSRRAGEHGFSEADILAVSIRLPSSLFAFSWML